MKVIDLLNKIANGEDLAYKIKIKDREYLYDKYNNWYFYAKTGEDMFINKNRLNEEVEIIEDTPEEDKKIEKIKLTNGGLTLHKIIDGIEEDITLTTVERTIIYELNKLIDKING